VFWLWLGLGVVIGIPALVVVAGVVLYFHLRWRFLHLVVRIFQEKPLFIIPRGQQVPDAEDVRFPTEDGRNLVGCYLRTPGPRKGVILFGLEFGSNRWACVPYCEHLREGGFDIFTFEFRSQGDSDPQPGYEPLQWVTHYEVRDVEAALRYLKQRPDADPRGVGFFGISKGASAGLLAGSADPYVRCFVTDGAFATYTTMVPYMRKWISIYSKHYWLQNLLPEWFYGLYSYPALGRIRRAKGCRFPHLERAIGRLAPRPLLMIHGGADTYIKPPMARALFERARPPKEMWLVDGAKHNQALQVAGDEYRRRVLDFFLIHLATAGGACAPAERSEPLREDRNGFKGPAGARTARPGGKPSLLDAR
jgi:pimeloyl-ACP methyl ester carboxylesterase